MYAYLRGTVTEKNIDHVVLEVGGVGYQVFAPDLVRQRLALQTTATLQTYCYIREDAFNIYGFLRTDEKALFIALLGITGIGPKAAMAIMSVMSPQAFGQAVMNHDVTAFTRISGVGKKTGQRIVLEMKARLGQDAELEAILGSPQESGTPESDDVIAALCALGCTLPEARKAAAKARKALGDEAKDEDLVKAALRSLSKV
ncbi:MAG: Holliday junction ATP-dependent DNA helicase RuvA [Candidatus Hydrogenedentota bacterium]